MNRLEMTLHTNRVFARAISPEHWAAYRGAFRAIGPRHALVDRWRHDLKWNVPEVAIFNWLAEERAKLVTKAGNA